MNEKMPYGEKIGHKLGESALWTIISVVILFACSVTVVLFAPLFVESTWVSPTSPFQVQMYEVEDPNIYISSAVFGGSDLQYVRLLKQNYTLLAFKESENIRIIASPDLERYVTRFGEPKLKLTSRLLLVRQPEGPKDEIDQYRLKLQQEWEKNHPPGLEKVNVQLLELYDPQLEEVFAYDPSLGLLPNWVDSGFVILDEKVNHPYHQDLGVVYVQNPQEYRLSPIHYGTEKRWRYDPSGDPVKNREELHKLGFRSRKELISLGEHIYAIEGCWYCHTDQTRTLVQDVVLNGSDSYPAPPSSPNEYIYQKITFPGTRRIGPDMSRVGIKRPSRDWHKAHFWAPKTASVGSIMPAFQHFFDEDPRGTSKSSVGIPNYKFEAIFQYLMTKGTRITPPTQAWWLGQDPIQTKEIIDGKKKLK